MVPPKVIAAVGVQVEYAVAFLRSTNPLMVVPAL